jgi:predicted naringenin-chalcone synthase
VAQACTPEKHEFVGKIFHASGISQTRTCLPKCLLPIYVDAPKTDYNHAKEEARLVYGQVVEELLKKTGIKPEDVDILITNCSIYCPTPSIASLVINKFKMREDIQVRRRRWGVHALRPAAAAAAAAAAARSTTTISSSSSSQQQQPAAAAVSIAAWRCALWCCLGTHPSQHPALCVLLFARMLLRCALTTTLTGIPHGRHGLRNGRCGPVPGARPADRAPWQDLPVCVQ